MKRLCLAALLLAVGCAEQQVEPLVIVDEEADAAKEVTDVLIEEIDAGVDASAAVVDVGGSDEPASQVRRDGAADAATVLDVPVARDVGVDAQAPRDVLVSDVAPASDAGRAGELVINEIRAVGEEWVELFNAGPSSVDLSDVEVTDSETGDGGPRTSLAMRFPRGTTLAPNRYVVVVAGQADAASGPQTRCPDGGPTTCFHASWSVSASRGETLWVLSPSGAVLARELYPMEAAPEGRSWGRLPNGSGAFAVTRPTPGASNRGP